MDAALSAPKVLLLAAQLSSTAQISGLGDIAQRYPDILQPRLLLRMLLTYLPETTKPSHYLPLLKFISDWDGRPGLNTDNIVDTASIDSMSDEEASRLSKRLRLLPLSLDGYDYNANNNDLLAFLVLRTHRIDSETGMLSMILGLLHPFESQTRGFNDWVVGTVQPFVRRYSECYTDEINRPSLFEFERLPDKSAVSLLLSRALTVDTSDYLHRDIQTILLPWISSEKRWTDSSTELQGRTSAYKNVRCAAWEHFLELFLSWSSSSWVTFVMTARRWRGARPDSNAETPSVKLSDAQYAYLDDTWSRAIMAGLYSATDASVETLRGAYDVCQRLGIAKGLSISPSLSSYVDSPEHIKPIDLSASHGSILLSSLRNSLLHPSNILTAPTEHSISLLLHLIGSAFIFNTFSQSISLRRAADLYLSQDIREQRSDLTKLMRGIGGQGRDDDACWQQARRCLRWLRSWNSESNEEYDGRGILGRIHTAEIETEFLKSLLEKSKFEFARTIYHTGSEMPLKLDDARNVIYNAALHAFDNAPNPNRNRGSLKSCNDIIYSLPGVLDRTMPQTIEVEALLSAAHALGTYRIVLKQGEPFSPVVLRVHSDPIAIIEKALEQNPKSYTRLQEFIEIGANLAKAGLFSRQHAQSMSLQLVSRLNEVQSSFVTERRVVGLCVEAALREDDFETAYSYVLSKLTVGHRVATGIEYDPWSWAAALKAGQYMRTEKSQVPTHLGTASGNLAIRHLQHRMECLATALLIAPSSELQSVLKSFRRCEEQLDSAIKEEEANEAAWDANADTPSHPGAFEVSKDNSRAVRHSAFVSAGPPGEDAPMSLFDLSRATAKIAQRNLNALSTENSSSTNAAIILSPEDLSPAQRPRKRDQFRDAATGTLVSGVGWLIGANTAQSNNGD